MRPPYFVGDVELFRRRSSSVVEPASVGGKRLRVQADAHFVEAPDKRLWAPLEVSRPDLQVEVWRADATGVAGPQDLLAGCDLRLLENLAG